MNINQTIENVMKEAKHCTDPEELRRIALMLNRYGAYDYAEKVNHKADQIERRYAELAAAK